jgi:hypothetical protein
MSVVLSVTMNFILLSVVMLNVILLNVVVPTPQLVKDAAFFGKALKAAAKCLIISIFVQLGFS